MFRAAARSTIRTSSQSSLAPARTGSIAARRFLTTAPPHAKSRSFKNSALRWGIAVAGLYYYNTSPVFAEHPSNNLLNPNVDALDDGRENTTLDQLTASSRNKTKKDPSALQTAIEYTSEKDASSSQSTVMDTPEESPTGSVQELEQEAEGEGAFNPITGEINWDCPCLGGMAYGPCGEEFRTAFSCFVYSTEEPKGMDCVDKFQGMQDCFRAHPEHYAAELEGDDDAEASGELAQERQELEREVQERREQVEKIRQERAQKGASETAEAAPASTQEKTEESTAKGSKKAAKTNREKAAPSNDSPQSEAKVTTGGYENEHEHSAASATVKTPHTQATDKDAAPESDTLVPKASHDAR